MGIYNWSLHLVASQFLVNLPQTHFVGWAAMFRSVAGVAQTKLNYGYCCTGKILIFSKSCTGFFLIYIGIIHFLAQTIQIFWTNVALISLRNLPFIWTWLSCSHDTFMYMCISRYIFVCVCMYACIIIYLYWDSVLGETPYAVSF